MHVFLLIGAWTAAAGGFLLVATALTFYSMRAITAIRGSPSWESWMLENLSITFIASVVFSVAGSLVLTVERILTLIT